MRTQKECAECVHLCYHPQIIKMFKKVRITGKQEEKLKWPSTLPRFVLMIDALAAQQCFTLMETPMSAYELGWLFMQVFDIDMQPYPDFHTMYNTIRKNIPMEEYVQRFNDTYQQEELIADMLSDTGVLLPEEEQIKQMIHEHFAKEIISRMSKFVEFRS